MPENSLPDLLVLGSINQDIVAVVPRLPVPGETIGGGLLSVFARGKGANQAVATARLGSQTRIVSAVGDDDAGRRIRGELLAAGVDTSLVTVADAATGTALIVVDEDGENQIAVCPGVNATIDVDPSAIARGLETGGLPKAQLLFVPPGEGHCAAVTPDEPSH